MSRRSLLSATDRHALFAVPAQPDELRRVYSFDAADMALIRRRRGDANRLGFAVQLALLRHPGCAMGSDRRAPDALIAWIAAQTGADAACWPHYGRREETRREHLQELRAHLGLSLFGRAACRALSRALTELAMRTDHALSLAEHALAVLRERRVMVPPLNVIDRLCVDALARADRRIYRSLAGALTPEHRARLDSLLHLKAHGHPTWLTWLRQSPSNHSVRAMLEHLARLRKLRWLDLPDGIGHKIDADRLRKMACEGVQVPAADFAKFDGERRYAMLVAVAGERTASVTDEIIELHGWILDALLAGAATKYRRQVQTQGGAPETVDAQPARIAHIGHIGHIGRALLETGQAAVEAIVSWDDACDDRLAPASGAHLRLVGERYSTVRRYAPAMLDLLTLHARPAAREVLAAVKAVRRMHASGVLSVPADAPTAFMAPRWAALPAGGAGIDRRLYEICVLDALSSALRCGDIWSDGARRFKNFDDDLVPANKFKAQLRARQLPVAVGVDCARYLDDRLALLRERMEQVDRLARVNALTGVVITRTGPHIAVLDEGTSASAQERIALAATRLPRVKITDLLLEVDEWTGFTRHFVHLKDGRPARDKATLLSVILADGINLGLHKMAGACPEATYSKLARLQAWHMRDETYSAALASLGSFAGIERRSPAIDLRIDAHSIDHAFAAMHLLGLRFAPRLADMRQVRLHTEGCVNSPDNARYPALQPLLGAALDLRRMRGHWDDILRLATSLRQGTLGVAAALRKLGGQHSGMGAALRELGRIERSLFILDWLYDPALRGRVHAELHRSEARDALARALFRGHAGSLCQHAFEHQRYRASALNLVTDAIALWNTVHLQRTARDASRASDTSDDPLLQSLAPLSCKHVDLGGSYAWGTRH